MRLNWNHVFGINTIKYVVNPFSVPREDHCKGRYRDDSLSNIGLKVKILEFTGHDHFDNYPLNTLRRVCLNLNQSFGT